MKLTEHYELKMPEGNEYVSVDDLNHNASEIDRILAEKADSAGGDISNTIIGALEETAEEFPAPEAGESVGAFFGKIRKFIVDFKGWYITLQTNITTLNTTKVDVTGGDVAETKVGSLDTITTEFPVPAAGDKTKTVVGKVKKFIEDFNNFKTGILTMGMIVNNAVTNNSGLPVSAAVAYALQNQLTQLNSDYVSRTKDNTVGSQLQLTKNNGIGGGSYAGGPV
ncbi:MAG: hypothetical protein ACRDBO_05300, partial [Lachnospiraceae bacterium]